MAGRTGLVVAGLVGAAGLAAGAAWLLRRPGSGGSTVTPGGVEVTVLPIIAEAGQQVSIQVDLFSPDARTVRLTGRVEEAGIDFAAAQVSLAPGQTRRVSMHSLQALPARFGGQRLTAVITPEGGESIRITFTATGEPRIRANVVSITDPAVVGHHAEVTVEVANTGNAPGTVTITGATYQGDIQQGTWTAQTVTVAPGETAQVQLRSAGAIAAQFAGQRLTAVFTTSDGQEARVEFGVAAAATAVTHVTFQHGSEPAPGDSRLLLVKFFRGGTLVAKWGRTWVHRSRFTSGFSQIAGTPVQITPLNRQEDILDGQVQRLPIQADQVRIQVQNLPDPNRRPFPVLDGLVVTLTGEGGRTLHRAVFNVGPGQSDVHTVNLI